MGDRVQEVEIYLNFIGYFAAPAPELTPEEEKRQEYLRKHRMQSRERYKALRDGTRKVGEPFQIVCKCCGKTFESKKCPMRCSAIKIVALNITGRKRRKKENENALVETAELSLLQTETA